MRIDRLIILFSFLLPFCGCSERNGTMETIKKQVPVLTLKEDNTILTIKLQVVDSSEYIVKRIKVDLAGTTDINDIESLRLFYSGEKENGLKENIQFGETSLPSAKIIFKDKLLLKGNNAFFRLSVKLKDTANLLHRINANCTSVETNFGIIRNKEEKKIDGLRLGIALRQHGEDGVDTYRIPGITTSKDGSLLAVYDVRRQSGRDLQGDIDIGLSRSTDGGNSWDPMRIVLDRGAWGGLPEKFNGISDPCILADEKTNTIYVAGLWMYGVLDENGKWIDGLTESSTDWNHQWRDKGSQPGFGERQTAQFLITKSTDDGKTWSEPVNLTRMCKKKEWWLWAPAPGHGITLKDGTLVFPTQGRDEKGEPFSNITWSKDGGETWHTSNPASFGTTENMVAELNDGSIMINARDNKNRQNLSEDNGRNINVTKDLGETWTTHSSSHCALIEPTCMACIHKHFYTENGQTKSVLLFSNPNSKTNRDHQTIKVSFDDGKTWPEKYWLLLDEEKGRGYSCITSIDEQTIGILYEGSQSDLVFQKIALRDLINR